MTRVTHLLSGLAIGGKERAALRLATRGRREGQSHGMVLFDSPFRSSALDLDPRDVPVSFLTRGGGVDLRFAWRLARLLGRQRASVVHAHNDSALFYAALARGLMAGRRPRIVATFHSWPAHATRAARLLNRAAARHATSVAVSEELASRLTAGGWLHRCATLWNGVDLGEFHPGAAEDGLRRRLGLGADTVIVGHVARFDPIKRHADLLDAAGLLLHRAPQVAIVLLGQGALEAEIRQRAAALPNLRLLTQAADMPAFYRGLDAFVLCSRHEAAPLALLEAMATGLPAVATRVGGMVHMLGAAGLLVPPGDPEALAGAIAHLAHRPDIRASLGAAARQRAHLFAFDAEWAAYAALYRGE